jgi:hypothetical protein
VLVKLTFLVALAASLVSSAAASGLEQSDLHNAARLIQRLQSTYTNEEKKAIEILCGLIKKQSAHIANGNVPEKALVDLVLLDPTPKHYLAYVNGTLGHMKRYKKDFSPDEAVANLRAFSKSMAVILEVDATMKQLDSKQLAIVGEEKTCIDDYLETGMYVKSCRPVSIVRAATKK